MWSRHLLLLTLLLGGCARAGFRAHADGPRGDADSLPVVTRFVVENGTAGPNLGTRTYAAGDTVRVEWTVVDAEGLHATRPVELHYTTDNVTWTAFGEGCCAPGATPTSYSAGYSGLAAPGTGYFRLKLVARDQSGNTSFPALSDAQNTGRWSIHAGSMDSGVGGSARSAALHARGEVPQFFAVHPTSGDIYAFDLHTGVLRLDAQTGLVSVALHLDSTTNLPDDGPLPARPTIAGEYPTLQFDTDGLLYVLPTTFSELYGASRKIYQIDLGSGHVRAYLGGGAKNDGSATPTTAHVFSGPFVFDEEHSLYYLASCTPGEWTSTSTVRLMKARQAADRTAGAIAVVAGNCVKGAPTTTGEATSLPFTETYWGWTPTLAVWNKGQTIYYSAGGSVRKILGGQAYPTAVQPGNVYYVPARGKLYVVDGAIREVTPEPGGADGETEQVYLGGSGQPGCMADGVDAAQACVSTEYTVAAAPDGRLLFVDGLTSNGLRAYRIRFRDGQDRLRTALGSLPFQGAGLDKQLVRAAFGGIHYKSASAPNQQAFPAGLYFLDFGAPLLGHIAGSGLTSVLWGNQQVSRVVHPTGTVISPDLSLGWSYFGGNGQSLGFDGAGLPWLRYAHRLARVDDQRRVVELQAADAQRSWWTAETGDDPAGFTCTPYGTRYNLALKAGGAFLLGKGDTDSQPVKLSYFDFAASKVTVLMGNTGTVAAPDSSTPGSVKNLSIWQGCRYSCYLVYRADEDRLYFSEQAKLRFLTRPTDPALSTLGTQFTGKATIGSFSFSPDGKQLFYLQDQLLHCHDLGSGKAWCNDQPLGPPAGLEIAEYGPNQMTWVDGQTLLISSYGDRGQIYRYTLEP